MHLDTSSIILMDQQRPKPIWNAKDFTLFDRKTSVTLHYEVIQAQ